MRARHMTDGMTRRYNDGEVLLSAQRRGGGHRRRRSGLSRRRICRACGRGHGLAEQLAPWPSCRAAAATRAPAPPAPLLGGWHYFLASGRGGQRVRVHQPAPGEDLAAADFMLTGEERYAHPIRSPTSGCSSPICPPMAIVASMLCYAVRENARSAQCRTCLPRHEGARAAVRQGGERREEFAITREALSAI